MGPPVGGRSSCLVRVITSNNKAGEGGLGRVRGVRARVLGQGMVKLTCQDHPGPPKKGSEQDLAELSWPMSWLVPVQQLQVGWCSN